MPNLRMKGGLLLLAGMLALGLAALVWVAETGSSQAQQGTMQNCPLQGKWAIAVWDGDDDADAEEAFSTCGADAVDAAYSIDTDTQVWSRWFDGRAEISTLTVVNNMQGVMALGGPAAPVTPTPSPTASPAATATPIASPTASPAATATPTASPTASPTAAATPTASPTASPTATATPSAAEAAMRNCPQPGKWAIAVWGGDDGTDAEEALATCGEGVVAAAYSIDRETQAWSRWFAGRAEISNLVALDNMQGVMALGAAAAPKTPDLESGWTKIEPGGDTICSQGTPYAYFVHPGTVNRLVVYFEGGGACWNDVTCSDPGTYFDDTVDDSDNPENWPKGIADFDNPDNPFKDWFSVFVPYCTGDIHWGDNTQTYTWGGVDTDIHHKGFVNVSAVLDWIEESFEEPEKVFVSGCSAGSYGSVMGAAYLHELYPDVPLYQLGDSGAGVITDDFLQSGFSNWGADQNVPDWIPALQVPVTELTMAKLYMALADYYSSDRWSQYNTAHDEVQDFFYRAMGGTGDWGQLMTASIQEIQDSAPSFHSYTAPGAIHCTTGDDIFYTREVNGVRFSDWVDAMVNDEAWDDVMCTDCETDPEAQ